MRGSRKPRGGSQSTVQVSAQALVVPEQHVALTVEHVLRIAAARNGCWRVAALALCGLPRCAAVGLAATLSS
jgi:hypothetical protein